MTKPKPVSAYRLSATALKIISRTAKKLQVTKTAVVEQAIRALAKREGFDK